MASIMPAHALGSRVGPPTQSEQQARWRYVPRANISSFPPPRLCRKAGTAQLPWAPLPRLRLRVLGQPAFPKCLIYRARTRVIRATATTHEHGHTSQLHGLGNKVNGAGCCGRQQRQTRDTAGSTDDQFISAIPSSIKPENNQLPARDEKAVKK